MNTQANNPMSNIFFATIGALLILTLPAFVVGLIAYAKIGKPEANIILASVQAYWTQVEMPPMARETLETCMKENLTKTTYRDGVFRVRPNIPNTPAKAWAKITNCEARLSLFYPQDLARLQAHRRQFLADGAWPNYPTITRISAGVDRLRVRSH